MAGVGMNGRPLMTDRTPHNRHSHYNRNPNSKREPPQTQMDYPGKKASVT